MVDGGGGVFTRCCMYTDVEEMVGMEDVSCVW
jgi:hypothetical protein